MLWSVLRRYDRCVDKPEDSGESRLNARGVFRPDAFADRLCLVSLDELAGKGMKGIIVDLDNTLVKLEVDWGEVKAELEPIIMRSKLTVILDLPKDLRPVDTDRQKVKQILLNLLSNAV